MALICTLDFDNNFLIDHEYNLKQAESKQLEIVLHTCMANPLKHYHSIPFFKTSGPYKLAHVTEGGTPEHALVLDHQQEAKKNT